LAGREAGAAAAILYLTAPGVALSSFVISTDAFLLPCVAAALAACLMLRERRGVRAAALLGAALGLGFLAKYAMIYTLLGIVIACYFDRDLRRGVVSLNGAGAALLALIIIAPNIYWNATHSFETLGHTASNANWSNAAFDPRELGEFAAAQFGVFGPLAFALLPFALWPPGRPKEGAAPKPSVPARPLLYLLILPPLLIVAAQAFISRANANWAAAAYPTAAALVAAWCVLGGRRWLLIAAIACNALLSLVVLAGTAFPTLADMAGQSNAIKRARGWDDLTLSVAQIAAEGPGQSPGEGRYAALVFDNRLIFHEVDYYGRTRLTPPLKMWLRDARPFSHAEATAPLKPGPGPFLIVNAIPQSLDMLREDFEGFEPRGHATVFLGGGKTRKLDLYQASAYAPRARDDAFYARWGDRAAAKD
jgi:hypothetical protein